MFLSKWWVVGPKPLFDLIGQPLRGQHFRMVVEGLTEIDPVCAPDKPADRTTNSAADCFFSFRLCFCGAAHVRVPPVVGGAEAPDCVKLLRISRYLTCRLHGSNRWYR
jgi:hypothetical protein